MAPAYAYSGGPPTSFPSRNVFDFCFSQPFLAESDFAPASRKVPVIEESRPVFVDNKSGG